MARRRDASPQDLPARGRPRPEMTKQYESGSASRKASAQTGGLLLQHLASDMKTWVLVFGLGLGVLGAGAAYVGLFVVASTMVSIFIVALTLYAFLRFWPEEQAGGREPAAADRENGDRAEPVTPVRRPALVPVVRPGGPPKARMMMALREMAQRQGNYRLSSRGAERFAKVIRYLLQNGS